MCSKDHALNTRKRLSIRDNKLVGAVTSAVEKPVQSHSVSLFTNSAPDTKLKICFATDPQPPHPVATMRRMKLCALKTMH
jgi:hypothetical protein